MATTIAMRAAPINTPIMMPTMAPVDSSSSAPLPPIVELTDGMTDEVVGTTANDGVIITLEITMVSTTE